jgi:excisionase family DNA binding protein
MANLQDFITVSEAAEIIGVCPATLRNWDRAGKLKAARNPMNGYRLYRREDVEALLARIERTASATGATRPGRSRRKGR